MSVCIQMKSLCSRHFLWLDPPGLPDLPVKNTQNFSFKRCGSFGSLFRTWFRITKRFKRPIWFCSWGIFRAWAITRKSLACLIPVWPEPLRSQSENCHGCCQSCYHWNFISVIWKMTVKPLSCELRSIYHFNLTAPGCRACRYAWHSGFRRQLQQ